MKMCEIKFNISCRSPFKRNPYYPKLTEHQRNLLERIKLPASVALSIPRKVAGKQ